MAENLKDDGKGNLGMVDHGAPRGFPGEIDDENEDNDDLTHGQTPAEIAADDETRAPEEEGGDLHESNG